MLLLFFEYITRCQSFLQMGKPDNDFLVYLPVYDMWQEQPDRLLLFYYPPYGQTCAEVYRNSPYDYKKMGMM